MSVEEFVSETLAVMEELQMPPQQQLRFLRQFVSHVDECRRLAQEAEGIGWEIQISVPRRKLLKANLQRFMTSQ